ncbi:agmatinase family protein [uncultured Alistipes sp.]|uniref:agmatinase family protein n=1 Tax=uncultured Alistipes sp. TaxID=538949 RepID=UPI0027296BF2|nr:agmatinase family protein [uncultured Alistipes sp.]
METSLQLFDPDGVGVDNGTYFGLPFTPDDAELVLISAPWDVTVSYGAGTSYGPDAIIEASTQLDFYDPLSPDAWRRGIATADVDYTLQEESQRLRADAVKVIRHLEQGGSPTDESIERKVRRVNEGCAAMNANIYGQACRWLDKGKIVGLVGGDHSTPYGVLRALAERHDRFGILHIDAHRDLREAYEGFEFSHASIMYNVLRDIPQAAKIVQAAVRDYSSGELELATASDRVESFEDLALAAAEFRGETWDEQCRKVVETLPGEVYVSFDIDGLSFENCPRTGTPVSGGLSFNKAMWLVDAVVRSGRRIIGFDVVEVAPAPEERTDAITGARVLWKLCGLALKSAANKNENHKK